MQLGLSSFAFGWAVGSPTLPTPASMDEFGVIAVARRHQLRVVQLGDHLPLHQRGPSQLEQLRRECGNSSPPLRLEIGARGLTETHLEAYVALAVQLQAPLVRFVIDGPDFKPKAREVASLLRAAVPLLEKTGVVLGIENHDRFPARALRHLVENAGSDHVGICLDTANSLGAGEGIDHVLDQLGPFTVNLHLKDIVIRRVPSAMGFLVEGRPAGGGQLDLPQIVRKVAQHKRCLTAVLETWVPQEASLATTIEKEARWVDESLNYLKRIFLSHE